MEGVPEEKCALVAELVQVLEMARQLEAHMAVQQQQGGGGGGGTDQRCRALVSTMRASIDRALHMAVSCCVEGRPAAGQLESPPHTQSCQASKQVQRTDGDPLLFDVVYHGAHTCAQGAAAQISNHPAVQEQTTSPGPEAGPAVLPFSLQPSSNKPTTGAAAAATSSHFVTTGCVSVTAAPFLTSPATPESQLVSSSGGGYAVGGGGGSTMAGVRNVPDVELASTTNSPMAMGEMDFMFPLDATNFLGAGEPASYF